MHMASAIAYDSSFNSVSLFRKPKHPSARPPRPLYTLTFTTGLRRVGVGEILSAEAREFAFPGLYLTFLAGDRPITD